MKRPLVVILAGGKGTRLLPLGLGVPKPLAPIHGRPFLEMSLRRWHAMGYTRFLIVCSKQNKEIRKTLGKGNTIGVQITYHIEKTQRGTGMAILQSMRKLPNEFFLANGDTYIDFVPHRLVGALHAHDAAIALAVTHMRDARAFGRVRRGKDGIVESFLEKKGHVPGDVYAGVAYVRRKAFLGIKKQATLSFERDILPHLALQRKVVAIRFRGSFHDIGTPTSYRRFTLQKQ